MLEVFSMTPGHKYWEETILFAEACSWKAGKFLADLMKQHKFNTWERVFIAYEEGNIAGFCTLAEKDELPQTYDFTPFIGFVFVDEKYRGNRISEVLIQNAIEYAKSLGFKKIYIMSGEKGLYEKYGFVKIGDYKTIYETIDVLFTKTIE